MGVLVVAGIVFWPDSSSDDVAAPEASASPAPSASAPEDTDASPSSSPSPVAVEQAGPGDFDRIAAGEED